MKSPTVRLMEQVAQSYIVMEKLTVMGTRDSGKVGVSTSGLFVMQLAELPIPFLPPVGRHHRTPFETMIRM